MEIVITHKGNFDRTIKFLKNAENIDFTSILMKYGQQGIEALRNATPRESGKTAESWHYDIKSSANRASITFLNSNINKGVPIAIILQYGHGTGTGGWVQGRDYINPVIQPIFDQIANDAWKEVTK